VVEQLHRNWFDAAHLWGRIIARLAEGDRKRNSLRTIYNPKSAIQNPKSVMSNLRFNHLFAALLLLSFFSAFVIPPRFTNPARAELGGLFSPVSRPTRAITEMIFSHFHPEIPVDEGSPGAPRSDQTILQENRQLRMQLETLSERFDKLSQLNIDRNVVRDINPLCKPATVTGVDSSGIRESLTISSPSLNILKEDMPVIYQYGLVGKISRAGITAAQVRLITDPGFVVSARISGTPTQGDQMALPLVQGIGHGAMIIRGVSMKDVDHFGLSINDTVLLDDADWPENVQGKRLGRITHIAPEQDAPLFARIQVEPEADLSRLQEVMVMVREK
jgi:hypothetical protein